MEKDKMGEKAKRILELYAKGDTPTEIMRKTGFSLAWVREVIARAKAQGGTRDE